MTAAHTTHLVGGRGAKFKQFNYAPGLEQLSSHWHPGQPLREARATSPHSTAAQSQGTRPGSSCVTISNAASSTTEVTPTASQSPQVPGERTDTQPLGGQGSEEPVGLECHCGQCEAAGPVMRHEGNPQTSTSINSPARTALFSGEGPSLQALTATESRPHPQRTSPPGCLWGLGTFGPSQEAFVHHPTYTPAVT